MFWTLIITINAITFHAMPPKFLNEKSCKKIGIENVIKLKKMIHHNDDIKFYCVQLEKDNEIKI